MKVGNNTHNIVERNNYFFTGRIDNNFRKHDIFVEMSWILPSRKGGDGPPGKGYNLSQIGKINLSTNLFWLFRSSFLSPSSIIAVVNMY